jgi:class 3 adenylate cyclase/YHS domain-containing protein
MTEVTLEQLSDWTGVAPETLEDWRARELIGNGESGFESQDLYRVRLLMLVIRRGVTIDEIASAENTDAHLSFTQKYNPAAPIVGTLSESAAEAGLDEEIARRFWEAAGLTGQGELVDSSDRAMLHGIRRALEAGLPEDAMLEMFRVFHSTARRIVQVGSRTIHMYVHEAGLAAGNERTDVMDRTRNVTDTVGPMFEATVLYFLRKAMVVENIEDRAIHIAESLGRLPVAGTPGAVRRVVTFTDLSASTPLAVHKGDSGAADVMERFGEIMHSTVNRHDGELVKQIGDEFMLVFHSAADAVRCLADVHAQVAAEPRFPAVRSGASFGEMLYRDGDYVGTVVNTAKRLVDIASPHQIVVGSDVRREARTVSGLEFRPMGKLSLKGIPEETEVFEVNTSSETAQSRVTDPVCGVQMLASEVESRLTMGGDEYSFCSDQCLRTFVSNPTTYAKVASSD